MTVKVENFLGRELSLPEDRLYCAAEGLWVKEEPDGRLAVGLTEPALLMAGGYREAEALVEEGARVTAGQTVFLVMTAKLKYLAAPVSGTMSSAALTADLAGDPYGRPLFYLTPADKDRSRLTDAAGYARALADSEGSRNPQGLRGGVSSTCKALYMGLREQKLQE